MEMLIVELQDSRLYRFSFFREKEKIPRTLPLDFVKGISRNLFTGLVKVDDPASPVQNHDQRINGIQDSGEKVRLSPEGVI
jgi:hypothetical protein